MLKMEAVGGEMIEMPKQRLSLRSLEETIMANGAKGVEHEALRKAMTTRNAEVAQKILELGKDTIVSVCMQKYIGAANDKADMEASIRNEIRVLERVEARSWFPGASAAVRSVLSKIRDGQ